ncbi:hypothetical protein EUGRSUZ_J01891 [Eucalyptus grandis]|uniref:Uncharacterized protein n=2 Tax=Eucalyptus grandis TaxID=71139 RepID=A0ACC3J6R1_EUCGR|nr:hypothetical protein EUGRSUZ_J01891 [Eucalyptus grandis]
MDKTEKARQQAREPTQIANRPKTKGQLAKTLEQGPFYLPPRSIMQSWVNKKTDPKGKTTSARSTSVQG